MSLLLEEPAERFRGPHSAHGHTRTTIFMGHMKNEVSLCYLSPSFPAFLPGEYSSRGSSPLPSPSVRPPQYFGTPRGRLYSRLELHYCVRACSEPVLRCFARLTFVYEAERDRAALLIVHQRSRVLTRLRGPREAGGGERPGEFSPRIGLFRDAKIFLTACLSASVEQREREGFARHVATKIFVRAHCGARARVPATEGSDGSFNRFRGPITCRSYLERGTARERERLSSRFFRRKLRRRFCGGFRFLNRDISFTSVPSSPRARLWPATRIE